MTARQSLIDKLRSYNKGVDFVDCPDQADIVLLVEEYSYKTGRYSATLQQCAFLRLYAQKILVLNHDDAARHFLPGLYTSLPLSSFDPAWHAACAYPETPHEIIERHKPAAGIPASAALATFRGMLRSSPVRHALYAQHRSDTEFRFTVVDRPLFHHPAEEQGAYIADIEDSRFVLCPRGWAPVTYRLFETMALARCPVIISDDWVPVAGIDWATFSLRVKERDTPKLGKILRARKDEAEAMGRRARHAWEQHFSEPMRFRAFLRMAIELQGRRPKMDFAALLRYWNSRKFRRQIGWTLPQRFAARWARFKAPP